MASMIGRTMGHYRIESKLGEGGMGIVYKARDTHLDRFVALKILPPQRTTDPERKRRFVQEAKAASALNHPNILHIYDIEAANTVDFIAMEYFEGQTLADLIGRKGLPVRDTLSRAIQVADGLAAAHAAGIVHRDIKPANIMVNEKGLVKILDFGLAKLTDPAEGGECGTTQTMQPATEEGTIVGTVAYMSPEQAEGKKVDSRSDIFSFGSVLYEMATGMRAFQGQTKISTLSAILHQEPKPVGEITPAVPRELERIISHCLRKDPNRRFQHIDDVKTLLEELKEESESGKLAARPVTAQKRRPSAILPVLASVVVAAAGLTWWLTRSAEPAAVFKLTQLTRDAGLTWQPALSPDGKLVAYASDRAGKGNLDIWLQQIGGGEPVQLTRHEADDYAPDFSPDGTRIVFRSDRSGGGIYVIPALGGPERLLAKDGHFPRFSPDGQWVAYHVGWARRAARIYLVPATGGAPRKLETDLPWAMSPVWSPDGKRLLFLGNTDPTGSIMATADWWSVPVVGGKALKSGAAEAFGKVGLHFFLGGPSPATWSGGGNRIVFSSSLGDSENLWEAAVSPDRWRIRSPPRRLTSGTRENQPSVAATGRIAFSTANTNTGIWSLPVQANSGRVAGELQPLTRSGAAEQFPTVSADGKTMVFVTNRSGNNAVWMKDLAGGSENPLVVTHWDDFRGIISPDGSRVAFTRRIESGYADLYVIPSGGGAEEKLAGSIAGMMGWSSDSRKVLYMWGRPFRFRTIDVASRAVVDVLQHPKHNVDVARLSPDDRWICFKLELEAGREPTFIAPVRNGVAAQESEWIQTSAGPTYGRSWWSPDGNLLYFLSDQDGSLCIWAQRLAPATKRPFGPPFAVYHFHGRRRSLSVLPFGYGLAPDKLYFGLQETTGNIWLAELAQNQK
jgi:Tol biopolymer transport system component/predicted Ser/Thr protein kinase